MEIINSFEQCIRITSGCIQVWRIQRGKSWRLFFHPLFHPRKCLAALWQNFRYFCPLFIFSANTKLKENPSSNAFVLLPRLYNKVSKLKCFDICYLSLFCLWASFWEKKPTKTINNKYIELKTNKETSLTCIFHAIRFNFSWHPDFKEFIGFPHEQSGRKRYNH